MSVQLQNFPSPTTARLLENQESLTRQAKHRDVGVGMDFDTLGEIIATRRLHFVDEGNFRRTVSVLVGKPQPSPDSSSYFCPFQIIGIGSQKTHLALGNDPIEALQSAMTLIGASLHSLNNELGGRLRWNDSVQGDLGFT